MRRALLLLVLALVPALAAAALPAGWIHAGNDGKSYTMDRDTTVTHAGKPSARVQSIKPSTGFGTMMQSIDPAEYKGKRVRFSAWVKAKDVRNWAGLWMRVDGKEHSTAFDNMEDRAIKGTKDWTPYSVVLDVADEAAGISFGILLAGEGAVWMSDVKLEPVDASVPLTGPMNRVRTKPENLDFSR